MKKQIRNALLVVAALLLVVLFYFLPNIQAALVDKKTFGQSEDLSLNPVEISVEATQTTLEKLKIINNHILSVAVRPSSRTVDGRDVEKTAKKQTNLLLKKMKIAYRVDEDWKITYKKLYTYIKKKDDMIDEGSVSNISNVKNLLVWYITLSPESSEDEIVNLIMDAYTDQILAIGSGGNYALSAARALVENTDLSAREIVEKSLKIAGDICVFTNTNFTIEELPNK